MQEEERWQEAVAAPLSCGPTRRPQPGGRQRVTAGAGAAAALLQRSAPFGRPAAASERDGASQCQRVPAPTAGPAALPDGGDRLPEQGRAPARRLGLRAPRGAVQDLQGSQRSRARLSLRPESVVRVGEPWQGRLRQQEMPRQRHHRAAQGVVPSSQRRGVLQRAGALGEAHKGE